MRRLALIWGGATAAVAAIVGFLSYQAGWAAGLATKVPAGVGPYYGYAGPHVWGFGFGFLPILLIVLALLFVFRASRWRRGWGPGWRGPAGWYGASYGPGQQPPSGYGPQQPAYGPQQQPTGAQQPPSGDPFQDWPQRPSGDQPGTGGTRS